MYRHADLLRLPFTEDPLKIEKGLEVVSWSHFSLSFIILQTAFTSQVVL